MTNTLLQRCPACSGRKKCVGMGGIECDCPTCKGIGYIESMPIVGDETIVTNSSDESIANDLKLIKKRGRKPINRVI